MSAAPSPGRSRAVRPTGADGGRAERTAEGGRGGDPVFLRRSEDRILPERLGEHAGPPASSSPRCRRLSAPEEDVRGRERDGEGPATPFFRRNAKGVRGQGKRPVLPHGGQRRTLRAHRIPVDRRGENRGRPPVPGGGGGARKGGGGAQARVGWRAGARPASGRTGGGDGGRDGAG